MNVIGIAQRGERHEYVNSLSEENCTNVDTFDEYFRDQRTGVFLQGLAYLPLDVQLASFSVNELYVLDGSYHHYP
jgi:hypothetical protein